ncbi:MAG: energy-coupling factor transporter transmembrane component T family protein [Culicoidibacterales bacterium]
MQAIIGQYVDIDTYLHRLHPLTKMIMLIILMMGTLLYTSLFFYIGQLLMLIVLLLVTGLPLKILGKSLWGVRFIFIFIFIFNLIFVRSGEPLLQWSIFAIYPETITITINLVLRLLLLTSFATLLTLTTKPLDLTYALEKALHPLGNLAHILGMILSIALRFIPTLQQEAHKILKAQQSRGATFDSGNIFTRAKHLVSLLIPLFLISFNRAEILAYAMELRGYDPEAVRTRYQILLWSKQDTITTITATIYMLTIITTKFFL